MPQALTSLMVCVGEPAVVIKIVGRANCAVSVDFKRLVEGLLQRGYGRFVCDLTECVTMDSTFLGVLAGLGQPRSNGATERPAAAIELLNPNTRVTELLDNLGIAHLFPSVTDPNLAAVELRPLQPNPDAPDREEVCRTSLEAHQTLMALNPNNVPKFTEVAQFLAEDLKKLSQKR